MAAHTRRSMVSLYSNHASVAVNRASKVSMRDALAPLVCCRPQDRATGPRAAPNPAIAMRRQASDLCNLASWAAVRRDKAPTTAAPAYSRAAVVNAPSPAPSRWTMGVLMPNKAAASKASRPPRKAGRDRDSLAMDALFDGEPHRDALLAIGGQHRDCLRPFGQGDSLGLQFVRPCRLQGRFGLIRTVEHCQLALEP